MTPDEIKELLAEVSPLIVVPKGQIDKSHPTVKRFLNAYKELTGKTVGEGTCQNCILDALFELKSLNDDQLKFITMERKFKLKANALVHFKQAHYTNSNITDDVALAMVTANRNQARSFENGDALLKALDSGGIPAKAPKVEKPKGKGGRPKKVETPEPVKFEPENDTPLADE